MVVDAMGVERLQMCTKYPWCKQAKGEWFRAAFYFLGLQPKGLSIYFLLGPETGPRRSTAPVLWVPNLCPGRKIPDPSGLGTRAFDATVKISLYSLARFLE